MVADIWCGVRKEDFPKSIQGLIDLIGLEAVVALYRSFEGPGRRGVAKRLYVPKRVKADHSLARLIGLENLQKLSFDWGGLWIDFPNCASLSKKVRDREIRSLLANFSGSKTDAIFTIARKYNLSAEAIKQIRRQA